jgi:branched-chain amino acid transport system permease protein
MSARRRASAERRARARSAARAAAVREKALALVVCSSRSLLPFFFDPARRSSTTASTSLAYVVMALGLNIVVGFAGLLDLGYVAFFAIGAYTIGWFGSGFFANANGTRRASTSASAASRRTLPGIHLNFLLVLVAR